MQAAVHRIAVLLKGKNANVGIFDGQQPEKALAQESLLRNKEPARRGLRSGYTEG